MTFCKQILSTMGHLHWNKIVRNDLVGGSVGWSIVPYTKIIHDAFCSFKGEKATKKPQGHKTLSMSITD